MHFSKKFIQRTKEYSTYEKHIPAPYFRKTFMISKIPSLAELTICGLGFYELYINGIHITKGKFAPYISNPDDIIYYDLYEIEQYLRAGENVIGILLGNGFLNNPAGHIWEFDKAVFRDAPKLALSVELDGILIFEADSTFKTADSPILFDDYRAGEHYDARKEIIGWNNVGFDDSSWQNAITATTPSGESRLTECEKISIFEEIEPSDIKEVQDGYLYIFPYNQSGVCRLSIDGEQGQMIRMTHGEMIVDGTLDISNIVFSGEPRSKDGYVQQDVYICKGNGVEEYVPHFTFHGFQYVLVQGLKKTQATKSLLTYLVMHSVLLEEGSFVCSNETINRLQDITKRSTISNFFYFPMDCPHREKNGWTGDIAISAEHILLNYKAGNSLREWLRNVRKAQRLNGSLPGIIPTSGWGYDWGNGPAWDAALVQVPYYVYKYEGNKQIIAENFEAILKNIRYMMGRRNEDGLLAYGLGDWCPPSRSNHKYPTKLQITDTLIAMDSCFKASRMAEVLLDNSAQKEMDRYYTQLRSSFRAQYIQNGGIKGEYATQTALAMAIYYCAFEQAETKTALAQLVALIEENGNRFDVGILGARVLFRVLSDYGYGELAYKLITQKTYPSYGYWLSRGATTLWENFQELEENRMVRKDGKNVNSLNHHFWGDISAWFYRYIAGIRINPQLIDENLVEIAPLFLKEIDYCRAEKLYKGEKIIVEWKRVAGDIQVKVSAPKWVNLIKKYQTSR